MCRVTMSSTVVWVMWHKMCLTILTINWCVCVYFRRPPGCSASGGNNVWYVIHAEHHDIELNNNFPNHLEHCVAIMRGVRYGARWKTKRHTHRKFAFIFQILNKISLRPPMYLKMEEHILHINFFNMHYYNLLPAFRGILSTNISPTVHIVILKSTIFFVDWRQTPNVTNNVFRLHVLHLFFFHRLELTTLFWHTISSQSCRHVGIPWHMMTSSNENIFRVTGHLCGEFTGLRWIPRTKASDA